MTSTFSSAVTDRLTALSELADRYPLYVPVSAAAEFLHVKETGLRASIEQAPAPSVSAGSWVTVQPTRSPRLPSSPG